MSQDGLRCRGSVGSGSGGSTPCKVTSSTPVTCKVSKLEFPGSVEDDEVVTPLTGKHPGLQRCVIEDSGFHDNELSFGDSPQVDLKQPSLTTTSTPDNKIVSPNLGDKSTVSKKENKAPVWDREDWNVHLLSTLILIVVLGACGFGLILTLRHLKDGEEQWSENGKYLSIKFARESIEEQARLQQIVESIEEGVEYNSPLDAGASPSVEIVLDNLEDSVNYPNYSVNYSVNYPNLLIVENEAEDNVLREKRDLVGDEGAVGGGDGFRFRVARESQELLHGDRDGEFRFRKHPQVENAQE